MQQLKQTVYEGYLITTIYHEEYLNETKYKKTPDLMYETTVGEIPSWFDPEDGDTDQTDPVSHLTRWCKTYEEALENHEDVKEEIDYLLDCQIFSKLKLNSRKHYAIYPDEHGKFEIWQIYTYDDEKREDSVVKLIRVRYEEEEIDTCLEVVKQLNENEIKNMKKVDGAD